MTLDARGRGMWIRVAEDRTTITFALVVARAGVGLVELERTTYARELVDR